MKTALFNRCLASGLVLAQALFVPALAADKAAPLSTFGKLPIKELTVFKDGHAFVAHEGEMPTDDRGNVVMDYLPAPVIGTFSAEENGNRYTRVDLAGKITVTSHRAQPTELEITRYVLGAADSADADGKVEKINVFENGEYLTGGDYPYWWNWYGWPHWWNYFNGIGRVTWKLTFEPNQGKELGYQWHYFWR